MIDNNATIDARHEACFVMAGRKAILIGGRGEKLVDIYDPVNRTWSVGKSPPVDTVHHMQCVSIDEKVYIVAAYTGGYPYEPNLGMILVYDLKADTWEEKTPLPESRRRGSAAVVAVGRKLYVSHGSIGGHEQEEGDKVKVVGWLDYYDIDTDTWTVGTLPDAPHPRDHTGGALVNDRYICVSGGRDGGTHTWPEVAETDCFDLQTETWSTEADIPQMRAGSAYGTSCDGKLIVAGGEGFGQAWQQVDVFDGTTWETMDSMVEPRHGTGLAVDCECRQIHIASGAGKEGGGPELFSIETYFFGGEDQPCLA